MPAPQLPDAVLWDLDGTLLDTEPYWKAEEHALVGSFGGTWDQADSLAIVGMALDDAAAYIKAHSPVELSVAQIVEKMVEGVRRRMMHATPWRPGALELLTGLGALGVPCALVTMSWRPITEVVDEVAPPGAFAVTISGDTVRRGKPHPEPYLTAARRLGVDPPRCVAIEDSLTGARSAIAAGVPTLVVPGAAPVPPLPGAVHLPTLAGVGPEDLLPLATPAAPGRGA